MKTALTKVLFFAAGISLTVFSCKKDDAAPAAVTNDEAAYAVGEMITPDFAGSASDAASVSSKDAAGANGRVASGNGRSLATSCGVLKDSVVSRFSAGGALITYSWTGHYSYTMACDGKVPTGLTLTFDGTNTRTGIKFSSAGSSHGEWTLTGFSADKYSIDGTFSRVETNTEIGGTKTFTGTHTWTVTDVLIDKATHQIKGGSATYTLLGQTGAGVVYTHAGTITFSDSNTATITVNGNNYTLHMLTGVVVRA